MFGKETRKMRSLVTLEGKLTDEGKAFFAEKAYIFY